MHSSLKAGVLQRFLKSDHGNIGLMAALIVPLLVAVLCVCLDYMMLSNKRQVLESSLDSASLAAVIALESEKKTTNDVDTYALDFLAAQLKGRMSDDEVAALIASTTVTTTRTASGFNKSYRVIMKANLSVSLTPFTRLVDASLAHIEVASNIAGQNAEQGSFRSSCCRSPRQKAADY